MECGPLLNGCHGGSHERVPRIAGGECCYRVKPRRTKLENAVSRRLEVIVPHCCPQTSSGEAAHGRERAIGLAYRLERRGAGGAGSICHARFAAFDM
jgi:hypothetical protein